MEWIDISKQTPEDGDLCQIKTLNGQQAICRCKKIQDGTCIFQYHVAGQVTIWQNVTYWKPCHNNSREQDNEMD